jgi:hypothetical protein
MNEPKCICRTQILDKKLLNGDVGQPLSHPCKYVNSNFINIFYFFYEKGLDFLSICFISLIDYPAISKVGSIKIFHNKWIKRKYEI